MSTHGDLYQGISFIIKMNDDELKTKSNDELKRYRLALKSCYRKIRRVHKKYDPSKSFYRDSGTQMDNIEDMLDQIDDLIKNPEINKIRKPNSNLEKGKQYFIIAKLLATNKIEIKDKSAFFYKGIEYKFGSRLSKVISEEFKIKNKGFVLYLNDFKSKSGEKYFLKVLDSNNQFIEKNVRVLKTLHNYFLDHQIEVKNKDFLKSFEILRNNNKIKAI